MSKVFQIVLLLFTLLFILTSCIIDNPDSIIKMTGNSLNEERVKYFQLNSYDNALDLTGNLELASGKITIKIISNDTNEVFFINEYVSKSIIGIHIDNLHNQKNINLVLTGENAGKYNLTLTSVQKLVLDLEAPVKPEK